MNYDRLYSVKVHNASESADKHDIIKLLLVRMLKRINKNAIIYTEYNPDRLNETYPDIYMKTRKGDIYIYEIQKEITKEWTKQIITKYPDENLVIVPVKELSDNWVEMRKELEKYVF